MGSDELIGRDGPLVELSRAISAGEDGGGPLLLVGERGIGKTACLRAVRRMGAARGHVVLDTAGSEAETYLPFAGLHRLLRPLLGSVMSLPEAQNRALLAALGMHDGGCGDTLVVCLATMTLLQEASGRRGLLITADDLQWLDAETRHVLAFVARRLDGHPIAVVAASSSGRDALAGDTFRVVPLGRLDDSDAHRLVAQQAAGLDRAQRLWVVNHAVGNPLALLELARTAEADDTVHRDATEPVWSLTLPLERAFASGLEALPGSARDAVLVAAVAADAGVQEVLAAVALLRGHPVSIAVLEPPQALGLLTVDETRVHFTHPLVKIAIVHKELASRRQAAHRALGEVITLNAHRRAWHRALGAAAHDDAVAAELEATTADSISRGDTAAAIRALERAAELSRAPGERGRRLLLAARQAARLGQPGLVQRLLAGIAEAALSDSDRLRLELLREESGGLVIADSNRVLQLCRVARHAADDGETDLAVELADAAVRRRCIAPVDAVAVSHLVSLAVDLARNSDAARTLAVLALADPVAHGRTVLAALARDDHLGSDGDALTAYGVAARAVGHYVAASSFFDRAEVTLRARGLLGPLARNLSVAAGLRVELGEWDRAGAALIGFEALSAASMSASHRASVLATTAKLAALRGDVATAFDLVAEAEHSPAARSGSRFRAEAQIARGIACISAGRHDEAYLTLSHVLDPDDPSHHFHAQFDAIAYLAETAAHTGRLGGVQDTIERMRCIADVSGSPNLTAHLAYADAVLAPDETAEACFLAALASDSIVSPWHRARLQLAYGRWLRRQYRVTHSRVPLRTALTVLQNLGAARWAAEALDELGAAGGHDALDADRSAAGLLSSQELTIARLAAEGLSNREIGQQLYLSPRTVSSHLYRIFPKLGISTRGQIAARLDEALTRAGRPV